MRQFVEKTNRTYKRTLKIKSYHNNNIIYKTYNPIHMHKPPHMAYVFFEHCFLYFYTLQNIYDCRFIGTYSILLYYVRCIPIIYYTRITLHPPESVWANRSSKSTRRDHRTGFLYTYILLWHSITL